MADWKDLLSSFNTVSSLSKRDSDSSHNPSTGLQRNTIDGFSSLSGSGIILTDTCALASKFGVPKDYILSTIISFIDCSKEVGHDWKLLDMGAWDNQQYIRRDNSWFSYHKCLYDYCESHHFSTDISTSLLIIGGNDVIAVPKKVFEVDLHDFHAEIDLWYCFPSSVEVVDELTHYLNLCKHYEANTLYEHLVSYARFNVSRIPCPDGNLSGIKSFDSTIGAYLDKVLATSGYADIRNVCLTSAGEFRTASYVMSYGLPLITSREPSDFSSNGVYLVPPINVVKEQSISVPLYGYVNDLKCADCLFFNCHGSDRTSESGYYGFEGGRGRHTAFDTHLPQHDYGNTLFLSCACWGGRYLHYSFDESILLKTLFDSSTLVFAGSSTVALGGLGNAAFSENLLRVYIDYLLKGYCAGEAFLRAKLAYLALFVNVDGDMDFLRLTISEFNLFGDPMLRFRVIGEWHLFPSLDTNQGLKSAGKKVCSVDEIESIVDVVYTSIRNAVDASFEDIAILLGRQIAEDYSLSEVKLNDIRKRTIHGQEDGFKFIYSYNCGREGFVVAITDQKGNYKHLYISK